MRAVLGPALVAALAGVLAACGLDVVDCSRKAPREVVVSAEGASVVRVVAGAGSLRIEGEQDTDQIVATGTACASRAGDLERVELVAERWDGEILVESRIPVNNASLDILIRLPRSFNVIVDDSSGLIEVENVASVRIDDGSGSISVKRVAGPVTIDDESGDITVSVVFGSVFVKDGSGRITVSDVAGDVIVEDGSDDIMVFDVEGNFIVRRDGSGDISASDIFGDFIVERDGSGSVTAENIGGRFSAP
ncbi:MAG: hypothetical protein IH861_12570, partial [Chloroflexi bacterium]|nr:hypothetical protein [Chloroflexota bacterium]